MKSFQNTLLSVVVFSVLGTIFWYQRSEKSVETTTQLFSFEKHQMVAATITKPDKSVIRLVEKDGQWWIEGSEYLASMTMVNRIRHQLHDLQMRAKVSENIQDFEKYGLGRNAVVVQVDLEDGRQISFEAGDPNPTGVSYYLRPLPGNAVYTVKKAAVDYYSADFDAFRNRHVMQFDLKSIQEIHLQTSSGESCTIERLDDAVESGPNQLEKWMVVQPQEYRASKDTVRRILGRMLALKVDSFVPNLLQDDFGLHPPQYQVLLKGSAADIVLNIGLSPQEGLSYMQSSLSGDEVWLAKNGIVEELKCDSKHLRNPKVLDLPQGSITTIQIDLQQSFKEILAHTAKMRLQGDAWYWNDSESSISGATPSRLVSALESFFVTDFIENIEKPEVFAHIAIGTAETVQTMSVFFLQSDTNNPENKWGFYLNSDSKIGYEMDKDLMLVIEDVLRESQKPLK